MILLERIADRHAELLVRKIEQEHDRTVRIDAIIQPALLHAGQVAAAGHVHALRRGVHDRDRGEQGVFVISAGERIVKLVLRIRPPRHAAALIGDLGLAGLEIGEQHIALILGDLNKFICRSRRREARGRVHMRLPRRLGERGARAAEQHIPGQQQSKHGSQRFSLHRPSPLSTAGTRSRCRS